MSADPRRFFRVKNCGVQPNRNLAATSRRKTALENITQIGELEILNDIGFGGVGEGLRVLASVSDSVRVGQSTVPGREGTSVYNSTLGTIANTALESVDQGAQAVLDAVGLGGAVQAAGEFNPEVANRAVGQARQIFQSVKQGNFTLQDIPEVFSDLQNLEQLSRGIFNTSAKPPKREEFCAASHYASDLLAYAPKFNFLFIVEITFNEPYQSEWKEIAKNTAFVVKTSSRPQIDFEYEEINMYNFRTQVAKRTMYQPMTMTFYDDNKNAAHLFYTAYIRAMSPIANNNTSVSPRFYQQNSMDFERGPDASTFGQNSVATNGYASSLGPLVGNNINLLSRIRLYHVFDYGTSMNIYNFYNPRITSFTPSELTMLESGDGAEFQFQFSYDGLFLEPGYSVIDDQERLVNLTQGQQFNMKLVDVAGAEQSQQSLDVPSAQVQNEGGSSQNSVLETGIDFPVDLPINFP